MKQFLTLTVTFLIALQAIGQPIGIGQWRTHLPYGNSNWITIGNNKVYSVSTTTIFSIDISTNEVEFFDKTNGLSDVNVKVAEYDTENDVLVIAYDNTNLDVIIGNTIVNYSDIKRSNAIIGEKDIFHIHFEEQEVYLSTSFGIVVLDPFLEQFNATYFIGQNADRVGVNAISSDDTYFFAATEEGVKIANKNSAFLNDFNEWQLQLSTDGIGTGEADDIETFFGRTFALVNDTLFRFENGKWAFHYYQPSWQINDISVSQGYLMVSEVSNPDSITGSAARIVRMRQDLTFDAGITDRYYVDPQRALFADDSTLWVADKVQGLIRRTTWNALEAEFPIRPNGPNSLAVANLESNNGRLILTPGGANDDWSRKFNVDGYSIFEDNRWDNQSYFFGPTAGVQDYITAAISNSGTYYVASFEQGFFEVENNSFELFTKDNSPLPVTNGSGGELSLTSGLALDLNNDLWVTVFSALNNPITVKKADGTFLSLDPIPRVSGNQLTDIVVDDLNQKWMVISKTNTQGILVVNHTSDYSEVNYKILSTSIGNLPNNAVLCLAVDRDGEVWVGTEEGVAVFFCPGSIFSDQGCNAQQILFEQDGFLGVLLESERVNTIAVDGADRKWVGTASGVFLLSPDGTKQIAHYTEENSPLLSNNITAIEIMDETGEVFIGTQNGLISIRAEATAADENKHGDVLVYPNPVKNDYNGPIAVRGLAQDAIVKIADVNGHVIFETRALGGQAIWDGISLDGRRAKAGIYLVYSTNDDGSSKFVTKFAMIR